MEYLLPDDKLLAHERNFWDGGFSFVGGTDEAGRGPLAGPVVAAAVVFPRSARIPKVNDSKKLTEAQRNELFAAILEVPGIQWSVAELTAEDIDRMNILQASREAMRRAVKMIKKIDYLLIDGLPVPGFDLPNSALVKGDASSASIAAASILAKVHRDKLMKKFDAEFPGYGFENNKGYGTKEHMAALRYLGVCRIHRRSFAPVRNIIEPMPQHPELF
ncbi:MAG: ribonuclease HII [Victivallaceae bacterium]|nr:ribonuclease HII [Victivallaceae bacterium]NLK83698.1 ribonuclease HII [Lentisphaerota bacterium]MDD3116000.1 ribonuclease HII [Victivallaceae bacterium]MDD3703840.1 ribonuclease HII [Victivallaceae bacterium]MDD4318175.1 ribonuclease HII [Victivallaceae bacterium]